MEVCPYSYFRWCGYFRGPWVSFVMTDEFSVRVKKITSKIGVLWTHSLSSVFNLFLTQWIMAILLKGCKPDNFEPHNSLIALQMFEAFIPILLNVNLSLNQTLLTLLLYVRVVGMWGYGCRPQVNGKMPRAGLKWVGRCCLSIVTLGHAYPLSRLSVHHLLRDSGRKLSMKRNSVLPNHWPLFQLRTDQVAAWSCRNLNFFSHPNSTLRFEECRCATIISAILIILIKIQVY